MIIDLILDRKDGTPYNPHTFYNQVMKYENAFLPALRISNTMDNGTEEQVQKELCRYIIDNEYNPDICDYILSVQWIEEEDNPIKKIERLLDSIENDDDNLNKLYEAMEFYCGTHDKCEGFKHAIYQTILDQYTHHTEEADSEDLKKLIDLLTF